MNLKAVFSNADAADHVALDGDHWTTRQNLGDEQNLVASLKKIQSTSNPISFSAEFLEKQKRSFIHDKAQKTDMQELSEQARVVFDDMARAGAVSLLTGPPGAAKSTVAALWVGLARAVESDIPVIVMTQEKPALHRLSEKINLKNITSMTLNDARKAHNTWPENAIILIDEAGLLGTNMMADLLARAAEAQARYVFLIGDDKQLLPRETGQPFRWLRESGIVPVIELHFPFRQKTPELRQMVDALYRGDAVAAVENMNIHFCAPSDLTAQLRAQLDGMAPEKTLVMVHGIESTLGRLKNTCAGYRFYTLAAAQGLAIDHIILVITQPINLSELLVGSSRQRFSLTLFIDNSVYADKTEFATNIGPYPRAEMALDIMGADRLITMQKDAV